MIELTPNAQSRLNDYLNELRRVLSGSPAVDPADVERDIRDHIDAALAGQAAPVEANALDDVLRTLGSPSQWLPEGETPWYRRPPSTWPALLKRTLSNFGPSLLKVGRRIAGGPESYRLAYLSLIVLALGWILMPDGRFDEAVFVPIVATLVSFVFSRAALTLFGADRLSTAQKWLLYPALLAVYLPVVGLIFLGPVAIIGLNAFKSDHEYRSERRKWENLDEQVRIVDRQIAESTLAIHQAELSTSPSEANSRLIAPMKAKLESLQSDREFLAQKLENSHRYPELWDVSLNPVKIACGLTAVAGASWFLFGLVWTLLPGVIRNVFAPFIAKSSRLPGFALAAIGLLMSLGGVLFFL